MTTSYLTDTLLQLVESIEPKTTDSYIMSAIGKSETLSQQSILIAMGDRLEVFWNQVFSDFATNLIEDTTEITGVYKVGPKKGQNKTKTKKNNKVKVGKSNRQIDHYFVTKGGTKIYMESKCNLNFDTEKVVASNKKVGEVMDALGADQGVYFVPVLPIIPLEVMTEYYKNGREIFGVVDVLDLIDAPFTATEYFDFLKNDVAKVLENKGL